MTRESFQNIWKQLILRRAQDLYEVEKGTVAPNRLDLPRTIITPAPLADLLTGLGQYDSVVTGHTHHIIPPTKPAVAVPEFWDINDDNIDDWQRLCARTQHLYNMKITPDILDNEKRPLTLTFREEELAPLAANADPGEIPQPTGYYRIKAYTNEPNDNDALIRMVNDELFNLQQHNDFTVENSAFYMTPRVRRRQIVQTYVGAYVLDSNA